MFYIVIITFAESEDETLKCDHSKVLNSTSCGTVDYAVQGGSNF